MHRTGDANNVSEPGFTTSCEDFSEVISRIVLAIVVARGRPVVIDGFLLRQTAQMGAHIVCLHWQGLGQPRDADHNVPALLAVHLIASAQLTELLVDDLLSLCMAFLHRAGGTR